MPPNQPSLPEKTYSLRKFIHQAKAFEDDDDDLAFLEFMFTGKNLTGKCQAFVDPSSQFLKDDTPIQVARDFDSLIGISKDLLVDSAVSVYPAPNPREALSTSIHVKYAIRNDVDGEEALKLVPVHCIPNFQFGIWGNRCQIHIFFPYLASDAMEQYGSGLTPAQYKAFYEVGLRPAIATLLPGDVSDWPPTYNAELFRAKKTTGHVSYQTKMVPWYEVTELADTLRTKLAEGGLEWAVGFFFVHTVRGVKHATQHEATTEAAEASLFLFLQEVNVPADALERGDWWIDVGMEIHSPDELCLQWATVSHPHIVQEVLKISPEHASRIATLGSSRYYRDIATRLMAVSGCRIEPGTRARGEYDATYFQIYTTDKAITYNPEGRHRGKAMPISAAMGTTQPATFIAGLREVFVAAMTKNASNARIEVRVPVEHAGTVLTDVDLSIVKSSLFAFRRADWWNFRVLNVEAVNRVLMQQANGRPELRVTYEALLLTAACVWLLNGLHSRPDDGMAGRSLMRAILPLTDAADPDRNALIYRSWEGGDDDDEGEYLIPYNPYGAIFLRRVVLDVDVPRFAYDPNVPALSDGAFEYLFGQSFEEVRYKYNPVGIVPRGVEATHRIITNKTKRTPRFILDTEVETQEGPLFDLASKGYSLPPPVHDDGSDMEMLGEDERARGAENIDEKVTRMYRQFLVDVVTKSPAPRGAARASYLKLTAHERVRVTEEVYQNLNLSDAWRSCRWKIGTTGERDLAFSHLFPEPEHETSSKVQNYTQCQYYRTWKEICATATPATSKAIRAALRRKVFSLNWIPYACSDKMWATAQKLKGFQRLPPGTTGPAPHILCRAMPTWED